jgi:cardiolipin synthase
MPKRRNAVLLCAAAAISPLTSVYAAPDQAFDGAAARAGFNLPFPFPDIFHRRPKTPQGELADAANGNETAILGLSDETLAMASSDQKVAMLKTLIEYSRPRQGGEDNNNNDSNQPAREQSIVRILRSANTSPASFDRVFFRVDPKNIPGALSDAQPVFDMVERNRSSVRPGDWAGMDAYLDVATDSKSSGKNTVEFLIDGGVIAPGMAVLSNAAKSIHLEVFQYQADDFGWAVAKVLAERAQKGVHVRIMLDANGSSTATDAGIQKIMAFLTAAGVQVIVKSPSFANNHLDHRKVMVVDGDTAFTGGMNIGQSYQQDWHDQQTLIQGPAVTALQNAFVERWRAAGGTIPDAETPDLYPALREDPNGAQTRVVTHEGGAKDQNIRAMYLRAIDTAETSIRIANPYFMDPSVVAELTRAARRGVKVQVVLPQDNDVGIVQRGSRAYYPDLIAAGIEVYEYQGRMAHEKVAVFDSRWSTFGSSNLDARSLRYNDELNLAVSDPAVARYIEQNLFDADMKRSQRIPSYTPNLREKLDRSLEDLL